jgi:cellobiose phosphorylase
MRPDAKGLVINPAVPSAWDSFTMEKDFRGTHLSIVVNNPAHTGSGVKSVTLNGEKLDGNLIPADKLQKENKVVVELG